MLPATIGRGHLALAALVLTACGGRTRPGALAAAVGGLPRVPEIHGPLRLAVVYPDSLTGVEAEDSSFVFGSVGDGAAVLRINGIPVPVAPNGAWLAWIPFRGDSVITLQLEARTARDSARLEYHVRRARRFVPPAARLWIDTTSFAPAGRVWWPSDQYLPLSVRASEGATLSLRLPGGATMAFAADRVAEPVPEALRAFDRDTAKLRRAVRAERYRTVLRGARLGDPGPLLGPGGGAPGGEPVLEASAGSDTLQVRWPLRFAPLDSLPVMVQLDDDPGGRGGTDSITVGRAAPAATYTWFFPTGTRARVSGRINGELRLALSSRSEAWVAAAEAVRAEGAGSGPRVVGSVTLSPRADRVVARIPVGARLPFQILEEERALTIVLYGAVSDVNWLRYGREDSLVSLATTRQAAADELELRFTLTAPVWGYHARWDGTDLLLEI
ncbi:MAG TPA: hypothetical protein VGQ73_05715, partial [Gemmatimonadales bacterium]|nr:hypothetical protein [Gemmatimonadales bacterium]